MSRHVLAGAVPHESCFFFFRALSRRSADISGKPLRPLPRSLPTATAPGVKLRLRRCRLRRSRVKSRRIWRSCWCIYTSVATSQCPLVMTPCGSQASTHRCPSGSPASKKPRESVEMDAELAAAPSSVLVTAIYVRQRSAL